VTDPVSGGPLRPEADACRKVLVVEDDDSMREAITRLLGAAKLESAAFVSAEAVLAGGPGNDAACAVSDQRLPGLSGLELLARWRENGVTTPLILITAYDRPGLRAEALGAGVAAYFVKPFRGADLLDAVRAAISRPMRRTAEKEDA
jgi:two-component system response regulator FixJ